MTVNGVAVGGRIAISQYSGAKNRLEAGRQGVHCPQAVERKQAIGAMMGWWRQFHPEDHKSSTPASVPATP